MRDTMHNPDGMTRWGLLLEVLSEMSDVERQVVVQVSEPAIFVPDDLLVRWYDVFDGGFGLHDGGVSEDMLSILLDFDYNLDQLIDVVPDDTLEKVTYIREDRAWRAIRELAEWTLMRITAESTPTEPAFGPN
jgi:hypothetical protein